MSSLPNTNCVYGATFGKSNADVTYFGKTKDAQGCADACLTAASCAAFT